MTNQTSISNQNPWPWLEAFPENAASFFNGREKESEALLRCVQGAPVTVLFSKSGLGKSSLLQAGLFPRLRKERLLPVYIRLTYSQSQKNNSDSLSEQIAKAFLKAIDDTKAPNNTYSPRIDRQQTDSELSKNESFPLIDSFWAEIHRTDVQLRDEDGHDWSPVFVLDQFEEIFTLGAGYPELQKQMFYTLGDLIENRIPKAVSEYLYADDKLFNKINLDMQHYRFLVSLREDYLADLEEWADLIPRLKQNRYRLLPMPAGNAVDAIEKSGGTLVNHEDAQQIVDYLSKPKLDEATDVHRHQNIEGIEPMMLSLICSGLNQDRLDKQQKRLATNELKKQGGLIVQHFYERALKDQPEAVHLFVEKNLITSDGMRLSYPLKSAEKEIKPEQIRTLEQNRLIRRESGEDGDFIELIHDRLVDEVWKARNKRSNKKKRRALILILLGMSVVMLIVGKGYFESKKAKIESKKFTVINLVSRSQGILDGKQGGSELSAYLQILTAYNLVLSENMAEIYSALLRGFNSSNGQEQILETETSISSIANYKDNNFILGYYDGALEIFEIDRGSNLFSDKVVIKNKKNSDRPINFLVASLDGKIIVSGSIHKKELQLWVGNTPPKLLEGHTKGISSIAISQNGEWVVSGSYDGSLFLWNVKNPNQPSKQELVKANDKNDKEVISSIAFSQDGKWIVSGSNKLAIKLWDRQTARQANELQKINENKTSSEAISSIAFNSKDGNQFASGYKDGAIQLWSIKEKRIISTIKSHTNTVASIAFNPDGTKIISGSSDQNLILWNINNDGQLVMSALFRGHKNFVSGAFFSQDGKYIVSGGRDKTLRLWNLGSYPFISVKQKNTISSVIYSPDGKWIVSSIKNTLQLWNAKTRQPIGLPKPQPKDNKDESAIANLTFSPNGQSIISYSNANTLEVWDFRNSDLKFSKTLQINQDEKTICSVAYNPKDNNQIATQYKDGAVYIWDINKKESVLQKQDKNRECSGTTSLAFSYDGKLIVSGHNDGSLNLWNLNTGVFKNVSAHNAAIKSVAFSPKEMKIVSGGDDQILKLWDIKDGNDLKKDGNLLNGHTDVITSVAFSPDGKRIVSGSRDRTLMLWDVKQKKNLSLPLWGHENSVRSVAFSPDGNWVASGSEDNTLRWWYVPENPNEFAKKICEKLDGNMSRQEWREWVSPDIDYIKQCPSLPIPPDKSEATATTEAKSTPP